MVLVLAGSAIVGIASVTGAKDDDGGGASNPLLGDILIVAAQVITAFQMVVEEKFVNGRKIPALQAVGWEGVWGFSVLSLVLIAMYYIPGVPALGSSPDHFEDTPDAFVQIKNSPALLAACLGNVFSIAFFNFFGISVTKSMSAAHRMVLDSLRTIVIWAVSLSVGWQKHFSYLQLVGFIVLLAGTMVYNEVVHIPGLYYPEKGDESESQRELLRHEASGPHSEADNHLGAPGGPGSPPPALDDQWFSPKLTHYQAMSKA